MLNTLTTCLDDEYKAFCKSARQLSNPQTLSLVQQQECCLFVFLDGSAHFFDDFLKVDFFFTVLWEYLIKNMFNSYEFSKLYKYIFYEFPKLYKYVFVNSQNCKYMSFNEFSKLYLNVFLNFQKRTNVHYTNFQKARTGEYRLQPGRVNGKPHYVR